MLKLRTHLVEEIDQSATGSDARNARRRTGRSLRFIAKKMGISAPYLSDLELGRRNWTDALLIRFERAIR